MFIGIPSVVILISGIILAVCLSPEPPLEEISDARKALMQAKRNHSNHYSQQLFRESETLYDSAMKAWGMENKKLFFRRNYRMARECAMLAEIKAREAWNEAANGSKLMREQLRKSIDSLHLRIADYQSLFSRIPLRPEIARKITHGRMLLTEGRLAYEKHDYIASRQKVELASRYIHESYQDVNTLLKKYFNNYPKWMAWVDDMKNRSMTDSTRFILVEKFARRCYLYENGQLKKTFPVELGQYWLGDKRYSGDKATPEGTYRIVKKLEGKQTRYHKALLLDYPNEEDKRAFAEEKSNGSLPRTAKIGGLIEIHGGGGRGVDWTEGCIALTNKDMDSLYVYAGQDMEVLIIGSLKKLSQTLKR